MDGGETQEGTVDWPRCWLLNGHRWAEQCDDGAGPLVVCDRSLLLRLVEEGRPPPRFKRVKSRRDRQEGLF